MRTRIVPFVIIVVLVSGGRVLVQQAGQAQSSAEQSDPKSQQAASIKRLILKDGSFEPISKHEIKGKVVRYFSSERHEWEEIPYSLVDWPATERYARDTASVNQERGRQSSEAETRDRAEEEAKTPLVSAGLRLPFLGGVHLLDRFQDEAELNQLYQNGANINKNTAGNILRGAINPIASAKQTIELAGPHAQVQSHVSDPSIYVALDSSDDPAANYTPATANDHFRIVRCEEKDGKRVVGVINIAVYGKVKQNASYVDTKVEPVSGSWVRVRSTTPLQAGEYALVEILGKQGINTMVWDFGVNPSAPPNSNAKKEEAVRENQPVVLQKRNKSKEP
jgi:hypothetical protein